MTKAIVYTGGVVQGDSKRGGAGAVIFEKDVHERDLDDPNFQVCQYLGTDVSNIVADYKAVILGLKMAVDKGYKMVELRLDNQVIVNQLKFKNFPVSHRKGLIPLHREVAELIERFSIFYANHIPSSLNTLANAAANNAVDNQLK